MISTHFFRFLLSGYGAVAAARLHRRRRRGNPAKRLRKAIASVPRQRGVKPHKNIGIWWRFMVISWDFMGFHWDWGDLIDWDRISVTLCNLRDYLGDILSVYHQTGWFPQSIKFPVKVVSSKLFTRALRSIWIYLNRWNRGKSADGRSVVNGWMGFTRPGKTYKKLLKMVHLELIYPLKWWFSIVMLVYQRVYSHCKESLVMLRWPETQHLPSFDHGTYD